MERGYSVVINYASKELSKQEKIKFKDTSDCKRLDEETKEGPIIITPDFFCVLDVHNEKANGDTDYRQFIIVDADGTKYLTGSENFFNTFADIHAEMEGEAYQLKVYRMPSKNFKGKDFLTCSIA